MSETAMSVETPVDVVTPVEAGQWYEGIPDETTKAFAKTKGWADVGSVVKSYQELQKFSTGAKDVMAVPDITDEKVMSDFYNKMGRPADAKNYDFAISDGDDKDSFDNYRDTAHKNGLTNQQAKSFYEDRAEFMKQGKETHEANEKVDFAKNMNDLKSKWGADYDANIADAKTGFKQLGFEPEKINVLAEQLGVNDTFLLFQKIGQIGKEGAFKTGEVSSGGLTNADIDLRMAEIKGTDLYKQGDPAKVKELTNLYELKYNSTS
jgi:hypothetical protein